MGASTSTLLLEVPMKIRKVMLLGAVTCMSGVVTTMAGVGCSSDPESTPSPDAQSDAPADVRTERAAPEPEEEVDAGACPRIVALTAADLDESRGWKPALAAPGSCDAADLTKLEGNLKDTANVKTYFDLGNGMSEACVKCAIGKDTDTNWPTIIGLESTSGETGFYNYGACFGFIEGDDCGKALQYEQFCYNVACNACAKTSTERQKCINLAGSDGMCKDFAAATQTACPNRTETSKSCGSVVNGVKTLCGSSDGGADAGDDADAGT
jgi:hypothetical protein